MGLNKLSSNSLLKAVTKRKKRTTKKDSYEDPENMAEAAHVSGSGRKGMVTTDPRFAAVHSDPRFQKLPEKTKKVSLDSRFIRMLEDRRFYSSSAPVDKRGKVKESNEENPLHHYYTLKEEGREEGSNDKDVGEGKRSEKRWHVRLSPRSSSDSESDSETESSASEEEAATNADMDTDTGSDEEYEVDIEDGPLVQEENVPEIEKETHRLAVVNMDWNHVKAVDLYVLLSSFLPKGGQIMSVAVYPSDFGIQRMEEEAVHGPIGLFDEDGQSSNDEDDELDDEKLRTYERSKLRYYYAVVECDSVATADYLYKYCDGVEFERSSLVLDLRFIPDSMEFKHPPRDVATKAPASYEVSDFQTAALQQTKVNLSWDEDEPNRVKALKRKFNAGQLADMELKEYLASDSETDDDESENAVEDLSEKKTKKMEMYRALVQANSGSVSEPEDADQDMEVTFNTDLENLSKRILEKKGKKSETAWEAYLRKRNEKKKARKNRSKDSSEDESSDSDQHAVEERDDFFVEEPARKTSKKEAHSKSKRKEHPHQEAADEEAEASRAELELLLADDKGTDTGPKGYNLKPKKLKGKKGKELPDAAKMPNFIHDDPRFSTLFTSPDFALDPTDPQFKRCAAVAPLITQRQQRNKLEGKDELPPEDHKTEQDDSLNHDESKKAQYELSSLIKSVKMKSQQARLPTGRVSKKKSQSIQF